MSQLYIKYWAYKVTNISDFERSVSEKCQRKVVTVVCVCECLRSAKGMFIVFWECRGRKLILSGGRSWS